MSAPTQTAEQRELALVGKVEMRIALADSDAKLSAILKTYLVPLLLKLGSEHMSVRQKVVSICQHVNTRIQPLSVQLPVAALVKQSKETFTPAIRHFDHYYIQTGVRRLSNGEQAELLPVVVSGISAQGDQWHTFMIMLRLLQSFRIPPRGSKEDLELRSKMEASEQDTKILGLMFGKLMLFTPQKESIKTCPGLTPAEYNRLMMEGKPSAWDPSSGGLNLLRTKVLAARLLASGLFTEKDRFLPALFASADPASDISDLGDDMMKRALPAMDLEDEYIIRALFRLYFGVPEADNASPRVRGPLRLKILGLLSKSTKSTEFTIEIRKMVADGVSAGSQDGEDVLLSNGPPQNSSVGREVTKLRAAIFSYINFVARSGAKDSLHAIAPQVIDGLRDFIENQGWPRPGQNEDLVSRAYSYEVIGLLAKAGPRNILVEEDRASLDLLRWLFDSLAQDASGNSITVSIDECLSTILGAMARMKLRPWEQEVLEDLLVGQMEDSDDIDVEDSKRLRSTRYIAVRFANRCLPYSSVKARWVNVLAQGATSDRPEVREEGERGLSPYWYQMMNGSNIDKETPEVIFPTFDDVMEHFFITQMPITSYEPEVVARRTRDFYKSSFPFMVAFARRTFVQQALDSNPLTENPKPLASTREKAVMFLRHVLQKGFLSRDTAPQESEMDSMDRYVLDLEEHYTQLEASIIRNTKIHKVMKAVLKLQSVPRDDEFHFRDRLSALLNTYNECLESEKILPSPNSDGESHLKAPAGVSVKLDHDWERTLDTMVGSDASARQCVNFELRTNIKTSPKKLNILICALFECLTLEDATFDDNLVEFLALSPEDLISEHLERTRSLLPILGSNDRGKRLIAANAIGILASHPDYDATQTAEKLNKALHGWDKSVGASVNAVHGNMVALGYLISRVANRRPENFHGPNTPETNARRELSEIVHWGPAFSVHDFMKTLFEMFSDSRDATLQEATHIAIGQMCMLAALRPDHIEQFSSVRAVCDKLYDRAKVGFQHAIICLGQLSMIIPEDSDDLKYLEDQLHKLHEIRQSEIHFTVGEAFSYLAAGWSSTALSTWDDVDTDIVQSGLSQPRTFTLTKLVDRVLADCTTTKPALKKAAVMWLLCLVEFCGENIQDRLAACQAAFRRCLSDRDELVQETASRGLGLVYEKGDRSLKDALVRDLVSSFSSDKAQLAGNVSADTQLFEPGALPTGDGSVSTYKDIMSLASEVGDSSLVYKFMSMASSNAIWSSRAAFGRFGLSTVLSDSSANGYLADNPKLYSKLFRYRFDPNGGVQRSMNDIWNALVPDSAATIDKHFDAIMEDILSSILGKEWRVRQACCAAIADLVQGRPLEKYEPYLERIWSQCFKVLDDIKESVRAAAASLARTLTGVLTRALEADHSSTKNASAMLKHVLPFLLSPSGMESSAKDTQVFSVVTLLEIIKKANGATIRPFIPELVERLIGLLSSLEPEEVNYVHLNAAKYNLTEQKIDDMRLNSVRSSPLMEAIERCLDLLDDDTMRLLQPNLESAMKNAVGLPSKVGASRVLVSLSTRQMIMFKPYADNALKLIEKLVIDRNDTVASSYAAAAGYVARSASRKQVFSLVSFAKKLYFESEGDRESVTPRRSITSGEIMRAFSKHATDRFNEFLASSLPFLFVAKHDSNDQIKELFQDTWNDSVGGSRTVNLYLAEILELCLAHLDSPQWTIKHTSARAVADATMAVSASEAEMTEATASALWPAIEKALSGKTWDGKEVVLSAFAKFVEVAKPFYKEKGDVKADILKIAMREAKRQNVGYRQHSTKALAQIALARTDVDLADDVFDVVEPIFTPSADEDAMEIDSQEYSRNKAEDIKFATTAAAIEALFASINPNISEGETLVRQLSRAMHTVAGVKWNTDGPAHQRSAYEDYDGFMLELTCLVKDAPCLRSTYEGLNGVFGRIEKQNQKVHYDAASVEDLTRGLKSLLFGPAVGVEALRMARADALVTIAKSAPQLVTEMVSEVSDLMDGEMSSAVRERLATAIEKA